MRKFAPGFYWVKYESCDEPIVAEFDSLHWFAPGWEDPIDDQMTKVICKIKEPGGEAP